jgi:hypothetical protein
MQTNKLMTSACVAINLYSGFGQTDQCTRNNTGVQLERNAARHGAPNRFTRFARFTLVPPQRRPSISRIMCPISPAMPTRPLISWSLTMMPPPMPVPSVTMTTLLLPLPAPHHQVGRLK